LTNIRQKSDKKRVNILFFKSEQVFVEK